MRVAYLDCFAGVAGDMFLGALLQAGVPLEVLQEATSALGINASLRTKMVDRSGISSTKVDVLESGRLAEGTFDTRHPAHTHVAPLEEPHGLDASFQQHLLVQHQHGGDPHEHRYALPEEDTAAGTVQDGAHAHQNADGRSLIAIRELIQAAELDAKVKRMAVNTFTHLGRAEAAIHNVALEHIHFHEVGAVDAIVDIVATCAGIHHLDVGRWYCSPLNVGGGTVQCAHGIFPVPAPATADLLRGMPTYSAHVQKELITPTGAALLRMLRPSFGQQPPMRVEQIGYGAGTRNPEGFPNVLRLSVGVLSEAATTSTVAPLAPADGTPAVAQEAAALQHGRELAGTEMRQVGSLPSQTVSVLETALDDASPQLLAYVADQVLAAGALDVMLAPVIMKKGRPGTLLTVLSRPELAGTLQQLLLRETTTLGVRLREEQRFCLERRHETVQTAYGPIRIKVAQDGAHERNANPEFEDCKAAALRSGVPLKQVHQAALTAWHTKV